MPSRIWRIVLLSLSAAAGVALLRRRPARRPEPAGTWDPVSR
jgi:hypothetical protein